MPKSISVIRQEYLPQLAAFIRTVARTVPAHSNGSGAAGSKWREAIEGECVQCGIQVSGAELVAAAGADPGDPCPPKVKRLSQGYCARNGCDSRYYRLSFGEVSGLDWN